jgi:excisionase family DNA binding protein
VESRLLYDRKDAARRFLTPVEASVFLGGLNSRTVTRWAREGYLPAFPVGEGKRRLWRFLESDLEAWMLSRRTGHTADIQACEYTNRSHRCSRKETP